MKKRKLIALLIALALAVLVALGVAVPRLLQNTPNAKLLRAVQQAEADADAGKTYDLSDAEALLMAMEPEKAAASLEKLSAKVEKAGDTPVVACLLEARLAQAGKLPEVDVTALARRALELPWESHHLAELPGVLAPLPQEELLAILAAETDAENAAWPSPVSTAVPSRTRMRCWRTFPKPVGSGCPRWIATRRAQWSPGISPV